MRKILTILILIICFRDLPAQQYFKAQSHFYKTKQINFGAGGLFSAGMYKKNIIVGFGGGFIHFGGPSPYMPLFFEIGLVGRNKKVMPLFTNQVGYGFTSGAGEIDKTGRSLGKGFFFNTQAGASIGINKNRLNVFIGATVMQSNIRVGSIVDRYSFELFNIGAAYLFSLKGKPS